MDFSSRLKPGCGSRDCSRDTEDNAQGHQFLYYFRGPRPAAPSSLHPCATAVYLGGTPRSVSRWESGLCLLCQAFVVLGWFCTHVVAVAVLTCESALMHQALLPESNWHLLQSAPRHCLGVSQRLSAPTMGFSLQTLPTSRMIAWGSWKTASRSSTQTHLD